MNKYLIMILAAGVMIALGGFLIMRYGSAQFDAGYNKAQSEYNIAAAAAGNEAARNLERIDHETRQMDETAIDADLRSLGIMREPHDR